MTAIGGLLPDPVDGADQQVELVLGLVGSGTDQPEVDRGVASVGDDGKQDVVAGLGSAASGFDRLDAGGERLLIDLEGRAWGCGQKLALAALEARQFQQVPEILLLHHVRE